MTILPFRKVCGTINFPPIFLRVIRLEFHYEEDLVALFGTPNPIILVGEESSSFLISEITRRISTQLPSM